MKTSMHFPHVRRILTLSTTFLAFCAFVALTPNVELCQLYAQEQENDEDIQFDENPEPIAVEDDAEETTATSAEDLLNLATELKITSTNFNDLTKVISYCNKAIELGLDDDNLEFAKQLRVSAQLDRGLAVAQLFLSPELKVEQLPQGWEQLRDLAINDLEVAKTAAESSAILSTALGRLYMLADKTDKAKAEFDLAVATDNDEQTMEGSDIRVLALILRAGCETDANKMIEFLKKGIELNPESEPLLYATYAEALMMLDRPVDALEQIDKALAIAPDKLEYKKVKAQILADLHQFDQARSLYEEATFGQDDNLLEQVDKARFLARVNAADDSIALFDQLINRFHGPGLYFLRGLVYAQKGEFEKALADANQALRLDSDLTGALRLKGTAYLKLKKYDEAARVYKQIQRKASTDEEKKDAAVALAFVYAEGGLYKKSIAILDELMAKEPDSLDLMRTRADIELNYGHWEKAIEFYDKIMAIKDDDSGVLNNYSWLLATCPDDNFRDAKRALEYGKRSAELTQYNQAHILSTLAAAYAENGDFESAVSWAQKALELGRLDLERDNVSSYQEELQSYKDRKPWRKTSDMTQEREDDQENDDAKDEKSDDKENVEEQETRIVL
ncbi:MAG: tetratricopeptide repeat protein [Planctomycetia bacterium]|nr:tetratricopeptide repeat protein [Planctomycetia bacterium]